MSFRDSLYGGDDEYIPDDLERDRSYECDRPDERDRSDSDIDDVLNKYYDDGFEV